MRSTIFRLLAGVMGAAIVFLAIPTARHSPEGFWPEWLYILSFFVTGAIFLIYAITGRAWPRSYGDKVFRKDDDLNDR